MRKPAESQEPNLGKYAVDKAIEKRRAAQFQGGHNPMAMTPFEKSKVEGESMERWHKKEKFISGIQGVDGGEYC